MLKQEQPHACIDNDGKLHLGGWVLFAEWIIDNAAWKSPGINKLKPVWE